MKSMRFALAGLVAGLVLAGCNTAQGVKKDVQRGGEVAGEAIQKGGEAVEKAMHKAGEVVGEGMKKGGEAVQKVTE
ncbi:MAG: entericidin EcnAB [Rhodocyclales bacterium]|nr:entericidin EcnAB [Rhodocyclales bacterium]